MEQTRGTKDAAPWTTEELAVLRASASRGARAIADDLGRSERAVRAQAHRSRISLRQHRETRGLVLGQPRGVALRELPALAALRPEVVAGTVDLTELERRAAIEWREDRPICPECVARTVAPPHDSCHVCHLKRLARAHDEVTAEREAEQELWRSRQAAKRRRDRRATAPGPTGDAGAGAVDGKATRVRRPPARAAR